MQHVVDKAWFSVVLAVLSALMGVPALLRTFGFCLDFPASAAFWAVGALSSSFVYLKTGPFFVWLRRAKLMRCISIAFLSASILYLLAFFLDSVVGIVMIMAFPVASTLCSQAVNRRIGFGWPFVAAPTRSAYVRAVSARARDLVPAIPRTLLYTLIFGVTSYTVLNFAVAENLVVFIGVSILVSAVIFVIFALSREAEIDSDRYRMLLLPLIAIAVLPFPYVPDIYRIFFLALVVFGFTCFDAITWGDLADEIRDRKLAVYVSYAVPTVANFVGIFIGWGTGALLHATLGNAGFDTGFAVFSIVIVIALVVLLVGDLVALEKSAAAEPHADSFMEKWKSVCEDIADAHELTNQERKIYLMLVRGAQPALHCQRTGHFPSYGEDPHVSHLSEGRRALAAGAHRRRGSQAVVRLAGRGGSGARLGCAGVSRLETARARWGARKAHGAPASLQPVSAGRRFAFLTGTLLPARAVAVGKRYNDAPPIINGKLRNRPAHGDKAPHAKDG